MSDYLTRKLRILGVLPNYVRSYREALAGQALQAEEDPRQRICSAIEFLLQLHLEQSDGWLQDAWVDGVLPARIELSESGIFSLSGMGVWSGNQGWFLDPLAARIEMSSDGDSVVKYSLAFGDSERGLGKLRYKPRSKDLYREPPARWCFAFGSRDMAPTSGGA